LKKRTVNQFTEYFLEVTGPGSSHCRIARDVHPLDTVHFEVASKSKAMVQLCRSPACCKTEIKVSSLSPTDCALLFPNRPRGAAPPQLSEDGTVNWDPHMSRTY
jgi:hypothetical protein